MVKLGGILHPNSQHVHDLLDSMSHVFNRTYDSYHYKDLGFGCFSGKIFSDKKSLLHLMYDGPLGKEELILEGFKQYGEAFFSKLTGTFAIALFDQKSEILYLVRDGIGQKTLYWAQIGQYFLFSSEIKGLLATGVVPQTPSRAGFASYLNFGFIPQDMTPISLVNKLLPGHYLKINKQRSVSIEQHFSLSKWMGEKQVLSKYEVDYLFEKKLQNSLEDLKSENTTSLLFSNPGTKLIAEAISKLKKPLQLLSGSFDEKELQQAAKIENSFHLQHKSFLLDPMLALNNLVKTVWQLDEPIADPSILKLSCWQYLLGHDLQNCIIDLGFHEIIARHDEPFIAHIAPSLAYRLAKTPAMVRSCLLSLTDLLHLPLKWRILRNIDLNYEEMGSLLQLGIFKERERKKLSQTLYKHFDPEIFIQRFHRLSTINGCRDQILYLDAKTTIPDSRLFQYEKLFPSAAISAPFLDVEFIEFIAKLPLEIKLKRAHKKRSKNEVFLPKWFAHPHFRCYFSLLEEGILVEEGIISAKWIRNVLGYPYLIPATFKQLFALLVLEIWFRLFINEPIGKIPLDTSVPKLLTKEK